MSRSKFKPLSHEWFWHNITKIWQFLAMLYNWPRLALKTQHQVRYIFNKSLPWLAIKSCKSNLLIFVTPRSKLPRRWRGGKIFRPPACWRQFFWIFINFWRFLCGWVLQFQQFWTSARRGNGAGARLKRKKVDKNYDEKISRVIAHFCYASNTLFTLVSI